MNKAACELAKQRWSRLQAREKQAEFVRAWWARLSDEERRAHGRKISRAKLARAQVLDNHKSRK